MTIDRQIRQAAIEGDLRRAGYTDEVASQTQYASNGLCGMVGSMGQPQAAPDRDLCVIFTRVNEAVCMARKSCERIEEISDRVKGQIPATTEKEATGLASGGLGDIARINGQIDILLNTLARQEGAISRLETL